MKDIKFKPTLRYVLEFFGIGILFLLTSKGAFFLMNLASTIGNIVGFLLLLTIVVSFIFYTIRFIQRIHNYLNN